jgi:hypothetical protein
MSVLEGSTDKVGNAFSIPRGRLVGTDGNNSSKPHNHVRLIKETYYNTLSVVFLFPMVTVRITLA